MCVARPMIQSMTDLTECNSLEECLRLLADFGDLQFPDSPSCKRDLSIVRLSAALLQSDDKRRLTQLALVGDAALSLAVVEVCVFGDATSQKCNDIRASACSDVNLSKIFISSGLADYVTFVAGVSAAGKPGATALEAMVGCVYLHSAGRSLLAVRCMALNLGIVEPLLG